MEFSNTTTKAGIIQRIEDYAGFDDGVITGDSTLLKKTTANVNETVHEMTMELMLANDSFDFDDLTATDYPIATTPLIADQRDYQFEGISFLRLKRLDVAWSSSQEPVRATPFDSDAFPHGLGNDAATDAHFDKTNPQYDPKSIGFWLYPRATQEDVDAGGFARAEFERAFTEYSPSDTTKEPPIDRPFHDLIAAGTVLRMPNVPLEKFERARRIFGEKTYRPDGTYFWTGGMGQMLKHYAKRNEDSVKTFTADFRSNYK